MNFPRPVIAFALLRQSGDILRTDVLGGVSILIRPIVADLSGHLYDANQLADRMGKAYGISLSATALEALMPRLIAAGVLREEELGTGLVRAVYCDQEPGLPDAVDEREFQEIIDDFIQHARRLLPNAAVSIDEEKLVAGFLNHLSTLDFSAIRARPVVDSSSASTTIEGPAKKETKALSEELAESATIDVIVASYVAKLNDVAPVRLALLSKVADGALGAELVLDLQAPSSVPRLTNTTAVIDTPLLLSYLDLSSKQDHEAADALIRQLVAAGAKIAAFRHSIEEAEGILSAIQLARNAGEAYGPTIPRLTDSVYRAFFESMKGRIAVSWQQQFEIIQETSTHYYKNFSAQDEEDLTQAIRFSLVDRRLTRERDAKSVAETVRRLGGAHIPLTQASTCKLIFVTGNALLRDRAARFLAERGFVKAGEFTPIVTDRYVAGLCWLITGGRAANSPSLARLLANCAAALRLRPELADRTKKFLANLDPEKARHFEALMTNERASQYLMETTFGNPDVLTAHNVEAVFEEAQRRAAAMVSKERDDHYRAQVEKLEQNLSSEAAAVASLREQVATSTLESEAKALQVKQLADEAAELQKQLEEQQESTTAQSSQIAQLSAAVVQLQDSVAPVQAALVRQRSFALRAAQRYADRSYLAVRLMGAAMLFGAGIGIGYVDKFWITTLSPSKQPWANYGVILAQAILGVLGLSVLSDRVVTTPLKRWRDRVYTRRLSELGIDDAEQIGERSNTPTIR